MYLPTIERPQGEVAQPLTEGQRILLKAAEIIEKDGLCKGAPYNYLPTSGPACLVWALVRALNGGVNALCTEKVYPLAAKVYGLTYQAAVRWSDHPDTSPAEVIAALREAARMP